MQFTVGTSTHKHSEYIYHGLHCYTRRIAKIAEIEIVVDNKLVTGSKIKQRVARAIRVAFTEYSTYRVDYSSKTFLSPETVRYVEWCGHNILTTVWRRETTRLVSAVRSTRGGPVGQHSTPLPLLLLLL